MSNQVNKIGHGWVQFVVGLVVLMVAITSAEAQSALPEEVSLQIADIRSLGASEEDAGLMAKGYQEGQISKLDLVRLKSLIGKVNEETGVNAPVNIKYLTYTTTTGRVGVRDLNSAVTALSNRESSNADISNLIRVGAADGTEKLPGGSYSAFVQGVGSGKYSEARAAESYALPGGFNPCSANGDGPCGIGPKIGDIVVGNANGGVGLKSGGDSKSQPQGDLLGATGEYLEKPGANPLNKDYAGVSKNYQGYLNSPILFQYKVNEKIVGRKYPQLAAAASDQDVLSLQTINLGVDDEIRKSQMAVFQPIEVMQSDYAGDLGARDQSLDLFKSVRGVAMLTLSYLDRTVASGLFAVQQQVDNNTTNNLLKQISWASSKMANPNREILYRDVDQKVEGCMMVGGNHEQLAKANYMSEDPDERFLSRVKLNQGQCAAKCGPDPVSLAKMASGNKGGMFGGLIGAYNSLGGISGIKSAIGGAGDNFKTIQNGLGNLGSGSSASSSSSGAEGGSAGVSDVAMGRTSAKLSISGLQQTGKDLKPVAAAGKDLYGTGKKVAGVFSGNGGVAVSGGVYRYCVCCAEASMTVDAAVSNPAVVADDGTPGFYSDKNQQPSWSLVDRVFFGVNGPSMQGVTEVNLREKFVYRVVKSFKDFYGDIIFTDGQPMEVAAAQNARLARGCDEKGCAFTTDNVTKLLDKVPADKIVNGLNKIDNLTSKLNKNGGSNYVQGDSLNIKYIYPPVSIPEKIRGFRDGCSDPASLRGISANSLVDKLTGKSDGQDSAQLACPITGMEIKFGICNAFKALIRAGADLPGTDPATQRQIWIEASLGTVLTASDIKDVRDRWGIVGVEGRQIEQIGDGSIVRFVDAFCDASAVSALKRFHLRLSSIVKDHLLLNRAATDSEKGMLMQLMGRMDAYLSLAEGDAHADYMAKNILGNMSAESGRKTSANMATTQESIASSNFQAQNQGAITNFGYLGSGPTGTSGGQEIGSGSGSKNLVDNYVNSFVTDALKGNDFLKNTKIDLNIFK